VQTVCFFHGWRVFRSGDWVCGGLVGARSGFASCVTRGYLCS
jgi:hypothetical protein